MIYQPKTQKLQIQEEDIQSFFCSGKTCLFRRQYQKVECFWQPKIWREITVEGNGPWKVGAQTIWPSELRHNDQLLG